MINHAEIYQTVAFKFGNLDRLAHISTVGGDCITSQQALMMFHRLFVRPENVLRRRRETDLIAGEAAGIVMKIDWREAVPVGEDIRCRDGVHELRDLEPPQGHTILSVNGCIWRADGGMVEVRKSIIALYRDFEPAHSAVQGGPEAKQDAAEIVKLPAENIDEMILKIRVALRCAAALRNGETLASIDGWKAGEPGDHRPDYEPEQFDCLCSLRDDLLRMQVDRLEVP